MKIDRNLGYFLFSISASLLLVACGKPNSFSSSPGENPSTENIYVVPNSEDVPATEDVLSVELRKALESDKIRIGRHTLGSSKLRSLYDRKANQLIFVTADGLTPMAEAMKNVLQNQPSAHGLIVSNYWLQDMNERWSKTDVTSKIELELLLSASFIQLATDIQTGRTNPQDRKQEIYDIELKKRTFNDFDTLAGALESAEALQASFEKLEPPHLAYKGLRAALARLHAAKSEGGWSKISHTKTIRKGDSDPSIPGIRKRLYDLGFIPDRNERDNSDPRYDDALYSAVLKFQESFKLGTDGAIGRQTFGQLAIDLDARIDQVRANLERWRLMPRNLGDHYILVDLNQQDLKLVKNGQTLMYMKVIVGRNERPTPTFVDRLTSVIINPYWYAPMSIVTQDILPHAWYDPTYFSKLRMRVLLKGNEIDPYYVDWTRYSRENPPPYTFRQDPGDHNSLGRLKFDLSDNKHAIYLHDTNHKELFKQQKRLFSSGCIRVEYPRELAAHLLGPQGYSGRRINELIADPNVIARPIRLTTSVNVYILGQSIAVDEDGRVRFGQDFYDQDVRLIAALNGKPVPGSAAKPQSNPQAKPQPQPSRPTTNRPNQNPRPAPTPYPNQRPPQKPGKKPPFWFPFPWLD